MRGRNLKLRSQAQTRIVLHIACSTGISQPFLWEITTCRVPAEICARTPARTRTRDNSRNLAKKSWWRSNPNTNNSSLNTYMLMLQTMIPNSQLIFLPLCGKKRVEKKSLEKPNKLVTRTNIWLLSRHNITSRNWVNEFKKLIKKLAGSKSRKIKKLAAWKKIEFLIKKNCA